MPGYTLSIAWHQRTAHDAAHRWLREAVTRAAHSALGGRLRYLISGAGGLPHDVNRLFHGLGFNLHEGYGLTEAAPVLTVSRPGKDLQLGSVGKALPGVEIAIHNPDEAGVGEVIARGPGSEMEAKGIRNLVAI